MASAGQHSVRPGGQIMEAGSRARALLLFGCLVTGGQLAKGQTTAASLSGMVVDPAGGAISAVAIQIKNLATDAMRTTTTDRAGRYSIFDLGPGAYELRAEKPGFKTEVQNPVI